MGKFGSVTCVGFMSGGTCACVPEGRGKFFFPSDGQGSVRRVFWGVREKPICWRLGLCFCRACCLGEVCTMCCQQSVDAGSWMQAEVFMGVLTN